MTERNKFAPSPHARGFRNLTVSVPSPEDMIRLQLARGRLGAKSMSGLVLKLLEFYERHADIEDQDSAVGRG